MGTRIEQYWDSIECVTRPVEVTDPDSGRFHAFVPHPVSGWEPDLQPETRRRLHIAEEALLALPRHEGRAASPAEWLLTRAESAASSTIEGVHPSARRIARAEAQMEMTPQPPQETEMEALRNISATQHALRLASLDRDLTVTDICDLHRTLMGEQAGSGVIREKQNWIGAGFRSTPLSASFVPPPPEGLPALVEDLVDAVNQSSRSPLLQAAVVHTQFEILHPFSDGNGRTGRALIHLVLRRSGLSPAACPPPISSSLALRRRDYMHALSEASVVCGALDQIRSEALQPWVLFLADAAVEASGYARRVSDHMDALSDSWRHRLASTGVRRSNAAMRLLASLPSRPVFNIAIAADTLAVDNSTATRAVDLLTRAGIVVQRSAGRRNRVYEAPDIMDVFSALANIREGDDSIGLPQPPDPFAAAAAAQPSPARHECGAPTAAGGWCKNPRPLPGNRCQAGHPRRPAG